MPILKDPCGNCGGAIAYGYEADNLGNTFLEATCMGCARQTNKYGEPLFRPIGANVHDAPKRLKLHHTYRGRF